MDIVSASLERSCTGVEVRIGIDIGVEVAVGLWSWERKRTVKELVCMNVFVTF